MNFYYENSNGRKIDLNAPPFLGVKSNDLFNYRWNYVTQGQAVQKIVKFEKAMVERRFQVLISGDIEHNYLGNLELFLQLTDVDINNLEMGKLWIDDYYLEGYIFASTKPKRYLNTTKTIVELDIVCENGNWQSEEVYHFRVGREVPEEEEEYTGYGIYYPYDYNYDYSAPFGKNTIVNEAYFDTDFELTFFGVNTEPSITIGGNLYHVNLPNELQLEADDILVINSKKKTVTIRRTRLDEHDKPYVQTENVFAYRDKQWNIFEKIKSGGNTVLKDENVAIDLKLFYERSEPKYTEAKWT